MPVLTPELRKLNEDISQFPQVYPITEEMKLRLDGISRLVMLDRYTVKDISRKTLKEGDLVILHVKNDPKFPTRGVGKVLTKSGFLVTIEVEEEFRAAIQEGDGNPETGILTRSIAEIEKPLELFYEQIALRNARGLSEVEPNPTKREEVFNEFYKMLSSMDFVPAGRVLYGAGAGTEVTYFNCYVLPFIPDSRSGISKHREYAMEIMSRGGGVGTNGSTLRPRHALARGVNGRSSGSVSWLNDLSQLTHLVEQGGSRRGAQMIMMADWHPDVLEFIISKMQNPQILRKIIQSTKDDQIKKLANEKLSFKPLKPAERSMLEFVAQSGADEAIKTDARIKLQEGGTYGVNNSETLSGANISICLTHEFMAAVETDDYYALRFPDVENYSKEEMEYYDKNWQDCGDVREWEVDHDMQVKTYRTIKASELWSLINLCATYAAEPGIFFIDNANEKTNARSYGQKVVATNPCGEQPLAPFSVCNLAAVNLANMANKETKTVDYDRLRNTVRNGVRMQDNVIDATPYFLEENKKQALGERRVGLGVMGLADLLIFCEVRYGSEKGNEIVEEVFRVIKETAYEASIELAKERGSFSFLENREAFIDTGFMMDMPEHIRQGVLEYGIRNSHLLTVAPTGSTGTLVGGSTGLEPYFSFKYYRSGRLGKFIEINTPILQEYLDANPGASAENLPEWFVGTMDLSPEEHADTQCIIQKHVDSSLSKTVNAPRGYTVKQVQSVYERLWKGGAKGGTVYVDGSRDEQVLSLSAEENEDIREDVEIEETLVEGTVEAEKEIGVEIGNTCPLCNNGTVIEAGGCTTCDNCNVQLKCGL